MQIATYRTFRRDDSKRTLFYERDGSEGTVAGKSVRDAAVDFVTGLGSHLVISICEDWDEKSRRIVTVYYWTKDGEVVANG
jgi:hypothetical protein